MRQSVTCGICCHGDKKTEALPGRATQKQKNREAIQLPGFFMPEVRSAFVGVHGINDGLLGFGGRAPVLYLDPLARLESLVVFKEVADLVAQQLRQVFDFFDVVVGGGQLVVGHGYQLGITAGFVFHVQHTNRDRKSTRLNSSHVRISYAVFCLKKKKKKEKTKQNQKKKTKQIPTNIKKQYKKNNTKDKNKRDTITSNIE